MFRKITEYLALQKNTAVLLLMVILVGIGERIAERFLPLYLLALGGARLLVALLVLVDPVPDAEAAALALVQWDGTLPGPGRGICR